MEASAASQALVGQVLAERYRLDKVLGEGGMGAVFEAQHLLMRKRVALKLLHADLSADEEMLGRFRREAQAAARIEHPNVAGATDFGQLPDGAFFLVLELVEGKSLARELTKGPLDALRALHIARQIALALERAHDAGVIHRDLKPDNIMLVAKDGDPDFVKVLDFGIAKLEPQARGGQSGQVMTRFGTILGTPEYMSPEQAAAEPAVRGSDFYAVGVMLYEMLTGRLPFEDTELNKLLAAHVLQPPPKMAERAPGIDVPAPIERLTLGLLAKDPKERPESAAALRAAIEAAALESGLNLPHIASARALPVDLHSEPKVPAAAPSWRQTDALAKTEYNLAAETAASPAPTAVTQVRTGIPGLKLGPIDNLPRPLAFAAVGMPFFGLAFILVVVASLVAHHSGGNATADGGDVEASAVASAEPTSAKAPWPKIAAAKAGGLASLEQLLAQFPDDENVRTELEDSAVQAAQRGDTADDAFAILENELGAEGVDGLYELATGAAVPRAAKTRASQSLKRTEIRAKASPAAGVALDLRAATTCNANKDVLPRAKESGDARALKYLKTLKRTTGCGFLHRGDCFDCLHHDHDLDDAIDAIEARAPKP